MENGISKNRRHPEWLKVRPFSGENYRKVTKKLRDLTLHTVCEEANCPNRGECFNSGTATFLLMGPICSRNCRFCNVKGGRPLPIDPEEPHAVAEMAFQLGLKHVVVTSVTRDDLPDEGAGHFAATVLAIKDKLPQATIEVLTPDFNGRKELIDTVINSHPDVFNHNVETVPALYKKVRPRANYQRSLGLLRYVTKNSSGILTKSGIMVGLGEDSEQLNGVISDLAAAGISILTIGQYLAPSKQHYPIIRYYHPDEFAKLKEIAQDLDIPTVVSAPLVRSSYKAAASISR